MGKIEAARWMRGEIRRMAAAGLPEMNAYRLAAHCEVTNHLWRPGPEHFAVLEEAALLAIRLEANAEKIAARWAAHKAAAALG